MSNPQHPQFTNATPASFEFGRADLAPAVPAAPATAAGRLPRAAGAAWALGTGLVGLGLWAILLTALVGKFNAPTVF